METEIPRYGTSAANCSITVKVTPKTKELWDRLSRMERVRVAQITRSFLERTLPEIERQITASKDSES